MSRISGTFAMSGLTVAQIATAYKNTTGEHPLYISRRHLLIIVQDSGFKRAALEWVGNSRTGRVSRLILVKTEK